MTVKVINRLLQSDPAIKWQVMRDILNEPEKIYQNERMKIENEGWGKRLLDLQQDNGLWGNGIYSPKWISATYTMSLLKNFGLPQNNKQAKKTCSIFLERGFYHDGGINFFKSMSVSETCVTGMILSLLSYFKTDDKRLDSITGFLLNEQMQDGGWNCRKYLGDSHSSFHTTISVLEGLREYEKFSGKFNKEIISSRKKALEFLLLHELYKSHQSGKTVDQRMIRFTFPHRWKYDILRCLDFLREIDFHYDNRINDSVNKLKSKQTKDGYWKQQSPYPGLVHFNMDKTGEPGSWVTLLALRVLKWYEKKVHIEYEQN